MEHCASTVFSIIDASAAETRRRCGMWIHRATDAAVDKSTSPDNRLAWLSVDLC